MNQLFLILVISNTIVICLSFPELHHKRHLEPTYFDPHRDSEELRRPELNSDKIHDYKPDFDDDPLVIQTRKG